MSEALAMRDKLFTMRMSDEESARLERVAQKYGLNAAAVIRMLIKREADALDATTPSSAEPAKPSKRKPRKR